MSGEDCRDGRICRREREDYYDYFVFNLFCGGVGWVYVQVADLPTSWTTFVYPYVYSADTHTVRDPDPINRNGIQYSPISFRRHVRYNGTSLWGTICQRFLRKLYRERERSGQVSRRFFHRLYRRVHTFPSSNGVLRKNDEWQFFFWGFRVTTSNDRQHTRVIKGTNSFQVRGECTST